MANGRVTDPTDRETFKRYIRSRLGEPVLTLNITEFQIDQAIDEALQYYRDYHYNGSTHTYYVHAITQDDINNRYFDTPDDLFGVTYCYDISGSTGLYINSSLPSLSWQLNFDLMYNSGTNQGTFLNYYINKNYYDLINQVLNGRTSIRFNMIENRVYLDNTWANYTVGSHLVLDGYMGIDPDVHPKIWSDRWLIKYAVAKVKRQWGENISKFDSTQPGGVKLNYERIIREADDEIRKIEEDCIRDYSIPPRDQIA